MEDTAIKTRVATVDRFSPTDNHAAIDRTKRDQDNDRIASFFEDTARFGARLAVTVAPEGSSVQKVLFAIPGLGDLIKAAHAFLYASLDRAMRDGMKSLEEGRKRRNAEEQAQEQQALQARMAGEEATAKRQAQIEAAEAQAQTTQAERAKQSTNIQAT